MADPNPNKKTIDLIKSKIIFEEAGISDSDKHDITESFCGSLKIILEWNNTNYPNASDKAIELFRLLLRVGVKALERKKFSIKLTKDKKGIPSGADGEVAVGSKLIWINLNSSVTDKVQIFIHEFTHFSLLNIFDNDCYPYIQSRDDLETSDKQRAEMVRYNKKVAPSNDGWLVFLADIPEDHSSSKTMDATGPKYGLGGVIRSFKAYNRTGESGAEKMTEISFLRETIPHMMEIIFILTDLNLNYEKIFGGIPDFNEAIVFYVDMLLLELRDRERRIW